MLVVILLGLIGIICIFSGHIAVGIILILLASAAGRNAIKQFFGE